MNPANDTSVTLPTTTTRYRHHVNWHEAVACAVEIELRDYADLLQFLSEYVLGKNSYLQNHWIRRTFDQSDESFRIHAIQFFRYQHIFPDFPLSAQALKTFNEITAFSC